jgi:antitoxin MazE
MRVLIKKWGNSASVRIPVSVLRAAKVSLDQAVQIREEGGRIIIEPIRMPTYELTGLLADMPATHQPAEIASAPQLIQERI